MPYSVINQSKTECPQKKYFVKITGVNTDIVDKDDYRAFEHAMLDKQYMYKQDGKEPSEVYMWGSNSNYTLGTGTQQQRNTPELLTCFNRTNTSVKQVCNLNSFLV